MLLASAARAGVGAAALALAGCGGPDVHNERDRPGSPPTRERQADGEQASIAQSRDEGSAPMTAAACSRPPLGISDIWRFDDSATVPPGDPADPLEWRERYHWRNLPRPGSAPLAGGELAPQLRSVVRPRSERRQARAGQERYSGDAIIDDTSHESRYDLRRPRMTFTLDECRTQPENRWLYVNVVDSAAAGSTWHSHGCS